MIVDACIELSPADATGNDRCYIISSCNTDHIAVAGRKKVWGALASPWPFDPISVLQTVKEM